MVTPVHSNASHIIGPLWGEPIGHPCIPLHKPSNAEVGDFIVSLNKLLNKLKNQAAGDLIHFNTHVTPLSVRKVKYVYIMLLCILGQKYICISFFYRHEPYCL